jgi:hypothetical protein
MRRRVTEEAQSLKIAACVVRPVFIDMMNMQHGFLVGCSANLAFETGLVEARNGLVAVHGF